MRSINKIALVFWIAMAQIGSARAETVEASFPDSKAGTVQLKLVSGTQMTFLEVHVRGKLVQTFRALGDRAQEIRSASKFEKILVRDLGSDGSTEVIIRGEMKPLLSAVWVFRWSKKQQKLIGLPSESGENQFFVPIHAKVSVEGTELVTNTSRQSVHYAWKKRRFERVAAR